MSERAGFELLETLIVSPAIAPLEPSSPDIRIIAVATLLVGVGAAFSAVLMREYQASRTILSADQIGRRGIRALALILDVGAKPGRRQSLVRIFADHDAFTDSIATLQSFVASANLSESVTLYGFGLRIGTPVWGEIHHSCSAGSGHRQQRRASVTLLIEGGECEFRLWKIGDNYAAAEIVNEDLDTLLTNRLLAMIEETLLTTNEIGVTYETYAAALIPILVGAARALNNVTNTDQDLVSSVAQSAERRARSGVVKLLGGARAVHERGARRGGRWLFILRSWKVGLDWTFVHGLLSKTKWDGSNEKSDTMTIDLSRTHVCAVIIGK
jgi:hypothetical protein